MAVSIDVAHAGSSIQTLRIPHRVSSVRAYAIGALTILIYLGYTTAQVGNTRLATQYRAGTALGAITPR